MKKLIFIFLLVLLIFGCSNNATNVKVDKLQKQIDDQNQQKQKLEPCLLSGGELVDDGWAGKDTGSNYCNQCRCMNGALACTEMACLVNDSSDQISLKNNSDLISQQALSKPQKPAGRSEDKYSCTINFEGYCIFSGTPHKNGLKSNTENIVDRKGVVLFSINEAVAVNSSGEILKAKGTPAFDGDELIQYSQNGMTDDEKAFHRVMAIMFPIRNALMYDIQDVNQLTWKGLVSELKTRGIKDKTFIGGATPKDNYYGRQGVFDLAKNPNGKDIHHEVMKFLEESGLYLLCHVTTNDFGQMLSDTHPEGHNPCIDADITTKISFSN